MAERIGNPGAQFFVRLVENFGARMHPEKTCTALDFVAEIMHQPYLVH